MQSLLLCCWKRVFAETNAFSWQNSISLCPASFCTPRPNLPVSPGFLTSYFCIPVPYNEKNDRMWSIGEGDGKPLQYSCLENPMNNMTMKKDRTLKHELPRLVGAQYATGDQWRNNSRWNEGMEPKQKQHPVVDVTGDRSKV